MRFIKSLCPVFGVAVGLLFIAPAHAEEENCFPDSHSDRFYKTNDILPIFRGVDSDENSVEVRVEAGVKNEDAQWVILLTNKGRSGARQSCRVAEGEGQAYRQNEKQEPQEEEKEDANDAIIVAGPGRPRGLPSDYPIGILNQRSSSFSSEVSKKIGAGECVKHSAWKDYKTSLAPEFHWVGMLSENRFVELVVKGENFLMVEAKTPSSEMYINPYTDSKKEPLMCGVLSGVRVEISPDVLNYPGRHI